MVAVKFRCGVTLLALLSFSAQAQFSLPELLKGTGVTPELSGLQVSLIEPGKHTQSFALGFAQRDEDKLTLLRPDHKLRIASISKLVVAIGVMRLVDSGKLNLDADVSEYLGWPLRNPAFGADPITARQLLTHTSSVRDGPRYYIPAGDGQLRDFFDPASPFWDEGVHFAGEHNERPGTFFVYSNLNFGLLGEVIERITGLRFDQYMRRQVIAPLGLSASFDPCVIADEQRAAAFRKRPPNGDWNPQGAWYAQVDGGEPRCFYGMDMKDQGHAFLTHYAIGSNASIYSPQGGLRASANDLVAVLQMLMNGGELGEERLLSESAVQEMLAPHWTLNAQGTNGLSAGEVEPGGPTDGLMTSYGLSVHRIDISTWGFEEGPAVLLGHLGEAHGVLSHALFDPETRDGIVTLISGTAEDPAQFPGHSPLYRVEEEVLRWWLARRKR